MEKTIANKMTFYDAVTLIVPGALVYCAWGWPSIGGEVVWLSHVAEFGLVMMIGLLLKSFGAWWAGCWFRNNTDIIQEEQEKEVEGNMSFSVCGFMHTWLCDPIRFVFSPAFKLCSHRIIDTAKLKEYYGKYDIAYADLYYGKRIEILESHVAFLQTWIWALVAGMFSYMMETNGLGICLWALVVALYLSIVAMNTIQRKIYYMVWECEQKTNGN